MSVTLTALRQITTIPNKKVESAPIYWQFVIVKRQPYNDGIYESAYYDAEESKEFNVGNWTYYHMFVDWLITTFPEFKNYEDALNTYTINGQFCSTLSSLLNEKVSLLPNTTPENKEFLNTFHTIKSAFNFAGRKGAVFFS
ncbi:hypothetical protein L292_0552 [Acinetobacter junii CIP 107470 = MTCC 11364]|uniref:Uncharacterized protein n=1 Tax=Acinetobacter junii CIP 107470 = MTCC 11364 TaxID=1217666 RepID=S7XVF2_ACIJU|nr:hypothetical protein [Acinetobacter junii]ENV52049.1 hypothetical protein F953_00539 [Acinetobacter junii CIP 107470 = MTCC 11364]EPR83074.1 hypothetical protein L292_0552 [Acinetobacter junii CIP 107470 = MTCC 11364]